MKIIITEDYEEMSRLAAEELVKIIKEVPNPVLGLATGSTPVGVYELLARFYSEGKLSFKNVRTVNLDEYIGLGRDNEQSYISFMTENLFKKVDLQKQNTHIPDGKAKEIKRECIRYHELLKANRQDVQLLGLGGNGHIGFNEPGTPFDSITHVVDLTQNTIKDNARFFSDIKEVPTQAITMGISEIMDAKKVLLLASGKNKAQAVFDMVSGNVSQNCPASVLQQHSDCTVIIDKAAASLIKQQ